MAIFYLIAIIVLLVSALLQASFSFGKLGSFSKFFSHYGLAVGYVVEAIILTAGLVFRFNQYRLDKERLLLEMNAQEVDNTRILMEVQEAERSQVANQLHDVAGSLLSAAKLNISSIREKQMLKDEQTNFLLVQTEEAVRLVGDVVRNLSHSLSPVMLEKVGLKTSLEKVIAIVNASGKIQISLLVTGFENYTPAFSKYYTALYGMVYELLNNMVKHSGAKHALVQVTEHEDWFILIAEDDGVGMNEVDLKEKQMMGMAGLHSKINYFGGSIAFDKNHPTGLIVTIEIPIIRDAK